MTAICIDENSLEVINNNNLTSDYLSSNTVSLRRLYDLTADFEKGMSNASSDTLTRIVNAYGATSFYSSLIAYNNFIFQSNTDGLLTQYPNVLDRVLESVAITPIEYAEFIDEYIYAPNTIVDTISVGPSILLKQIDNFYGGNFTKSTMGAFCSLAPKIFGAVADFFSSIDKLASNITDIINKISNFSLAKAIDQLKKKILNVVNKQIDKVKNIISKLTLSNAVDSASTFIHEKITSKFLNLKEEAMHFFSKANIDAFTKKIEGLLGYAANLFKTHNFEEIQFLIYRFCSFASRVESTIEALKHPLDTYLKSYKDAYNLLKSSSAKNTVRAVSSGAFRYEQPVRKSGYDAGVQASTAAGNTAPILTKDIDGVTPWNDGKGDSKITFEGQWVSKMGEEGWSRIDPKVRVYLMRLQSKMGTQLVIKSGYRSKEYNDYIRSQGYPSAENSHHMQGLACDVGFAGFNTQTKEKFISYALEEGFRGIGRYNNFVHIDLGPRREWNGGY